MDFGVQFVTDFCSPCAVDVKETDGGLELLDRARLELELPELEPQRVRAYIDGRHSNPFLYLSERQARESGHFLTANRVKVKVRMGALNPYTFTTLAVDRDMKSGEVRLVMAKTEIDEAQVLDAWIDDGCPLEWTPPGTD